MEMTTANYKTELQKLRELNEELESYLRNTITPQLLVDSDLILRKFTPPAEKHFLLSEDDIGKPISEIAKKIQFPMLAKNIEEVFESDEELEKEIQTLDHRWYQMNILPYSVHKEYRSGRVILIFIDITSRIRYLKEVEKINADNENFIFSVSHDLREPLTIIAMLVRELEWANREKDSREIQRIIGLIDKSVKNMDLFIDELTDITKIQSDLMDGSGKVNVKEIMEEVRLTLKNKIEESNADITARFETVEIHMSRKNLRSILYNLISNAIKYRSPDRTPEIVIKTKEEDEYTLLSVRDNGIGIEEDKQEIIFSKFSRLGSKVEGSGVGLYIVNKIVKNSGGKIKVKSTCGEGTTFYIYFRNS